MTITTTITKKIIDNDRILFFMCLQNNKLCACSNELNKDVEIPTANCDVPCSDESFQKYCGGTESYSVYLSNYWNLFYV